MNQPELGDLVLRSLVLTANMVFLTSKQAQVWICQGHVLLHLHGTRGQSQCDYTHSSHQKHKCYLIDA